MTRGVRPNAQGNFMSAYPRHVFCNVLRNELLLERAIMSDEGVWCRISSNR
jgi:hypothetical protein